MDNFSIDISRYQDKAQDEWGCYLEVKIWPYAKRIDLVMRRRNYTYGVSYLFETLLRSKVDQIDLWIDEAGNAIDLWIEEECKLNNERSFE